MKSRFLVRIAFVCAIPLTFTACGFAFVQGPPAGHQNVQSFACTDSNTLPMLDAIWAGLNFAAGGTALATSEYDFARDYPDIDRNAAIYGSFAMGAIWAVAARSGYKKVSDCRSALDALAQRSGDAADARLRVSNTEATNWRPPMLLPVRSPLKGPSGN